MSQHDLDIANQGFPATRADINNALQALGSSNSGATAPSTTYANQLWYDTANNIIKIRNEDNDAWISLFTLDQTNDNIEALTVNGTITADALTVDTNTLHVDATNNRVGVGTTAPGVGLETTDSICVGRQSAATQNKFVGIGGSGGTFSNGVSGGAYIEYEVEADQDTLIHFVTNDQGNSHARRMTVAKDGGVSIADGHLTLASGRGINFGATGSGDDSTGQTVQSEVLNDYEHGLWTPTVNGNTTYHHQYGTYQKIGRQVTAWFRLKINAANTPGANFYMDGLPYNNDHNGFVGGTGLVFFFSSIATSTIMMTARVDGGGSTINFTGNGASGTTAQFVNIAWVANNAEIQGMVTYMTDYT